MVFRTCSILPFVPSPWPEFHLPSRPTSPRCIGGFCPVYLSQLLLRKNMRAPQISVCMLGRSRSFRWIFSSQCIFTNAWEVSAENPISFLEIPIHLNSCLVLYNDLKSLFLNIITLIDIGCCRSTRYFVLNKVLTICRLINWLCY